MCKHGAHKQDSGNEIIYILSPSLLLQPLSLYVRFYERVRLS